MNLPAIPPPTDPSLPSGQSATDEPLNPPGAALGILVVDDDAQIRRLLKTVLRQCGFEVFDSGSGEDAVLVFQAHRDRIVAALIDVFMIPNRGGLETLKALRSIDPVLCCCFITGGSGDYSIDELFSHGAAIVFHKPFDLNHLTRVLRHLVFGPALSSSIAIPQRSDSETSERRRFPRWPGIPQDVDVAPHTGAGLRRSGTVINRSLGGVALLLEEPCEIGSELRIRSTVTSYEKWLAIEVRHIREMRDRWLVGARFSEPATLAVLSVYG
jgi:DNA-binding response OmpR family regulator